MFICHEIPLFPPAVVPLICLRLYVCVQVSMVRVFIVFAHQNSIFHFLTTIMWLFSLSLFSFFLHPFAPSCDFASSMDMYCLVMLFPAVFDAFVAIADLSRNRLAKVTNGAFVNLSNLTYLDVSYNKLVKLESASVEPLKKLHTLNISGNIQMDLYDIREAFQVISFCISSHLFFLLSMFKFHLYSGHLMPKIQWAMRCDAMQCDSNRFLFRSELLWFIVVWPEFWPLAN